MRWGAERPLLRQYMRVRYVAMCESSPSNQRAHLLPFIASRRSALQSSGRGSRDGEEGRRPPAPLPRHCVLSGRGEAARSLGESQRGSERGKERTKAERTTSSASGLSRSLARSEGCRCPQRRHDSRLLCARLRSLAPAAAAPSDLLRCLPLCLRLCTLTPCS